MKNDYAIHWFRRDLRVNGNPSLQKMWKKYDGRVIGIFCFDKDFLSRSDFSANRFQFFLNRIKHLKEELLSIGSDLLVLDIGPDAAFQKTLNNLKIVPTEISFNRDYEPFARARDERMKNFFSRNEIQFSTMADHLVIEPSELRSKSGDFYKVYTPFSKRWLDTFQEELTQRRLKNHQMKKVKKKIFSMKWSDVFEKQLQDQLDHYIEVNSKLVDIPIPDCSNKAIESQFKRFEKIIDDYGSNRDFPDLKATSGFSAFLKNGSITTSQIINYFNLKPYIKKETGRDIFLSELIWREFYYHVLYHFPEVEKKEFQKKYQNISWSKDIKNFNAWKEGKTGYPIVDAGMRQLNTTGMMHNRVRMIVASFLTKHLQIDWRLGEQYFMLKLLDGDLAPNNGGWQWAASTGCDAQPYFRVFNPWLQSKRFDKEGSYIKKFVPELISIDAKKLHEPILDHESYPVPIVEHKVARQKALDLFKKP